MPKLTNRANRYGRTNRLRADPNYRKASLLKTIDFLALSSLEQKAYTKYT